MDAEKMEYLGMDKVVQEMAMKVAETADSFIFETVLPFCQENYQGELKKEDLSRALGLLKQKPVQIKEKDLDGFRHFYHEMIENNHLHRVVDGYYWNWEKPFPESEEDYAGIVAETNAEYSWVRDGLEAVRALLDKLIERGDVEVEGEKQDGE